MEMCRNSSSDVVPSATRRAANSQKASSFGCRLSLPRSASLCLALPVSALTSPQIAAAVLVLADLLRIPPRQLLSTIAAGPYKVGIFSKRTGLRTQNPARMNQERRAKASSQQQQQQEGIAGQIQAGFGIDRERGPVQDLAG
ncbi:hypothetical protein L1887_50208 [Cichorium endivia]|nr:hypothetical protein L1887_50208 [Cichorium endivia]